MFEESRQNWTCWDVTSWWSSYLCDGQSTMSLPLLPLLVLLPAFGRCQPGGQFDVCRSLRDSEAGPGWEFYACQPPPANMKEVMQIRVDPPGITCGNPPERFCTLVSHTHLKIETDWNTDRNRNNQVYNSLVSLRLFSLWHIKMKGTPDLLSQVVKVYKCQRWFSLNIISFE